jgi:hypothetical protein
MSFCIYCPSCEPDKFPTQESRLRWMAACVSCINVQHRLAESIYPVTPKELVLPNE